MINRTPTLRLVAVNSNEPLVEKRNALAGWRFVFAVGLVFWAAVGYGLYLVF